MASEKTAKTDRFVLDGRTIRVMPEINRACLGCLHDGVPGSDVCHRMLNAAGVTNSCDGIVFIYDTRAALSVYIAQKLTA